MTVKVMGDNKDGGNNDNGEKSRFLDVRLPAVRINEYIVVPKCYVLTVPEDRR